MLKQYFSSSDERKLKEKSTVMLKEVSTGVYYVNKDRAGVLNEYITSEQLCEILNTIQKVAVVGSSGIYSNFDLEN